MPMTEKMKIKSSVMINTLPIVYLSMRTHVRRVEMKRKRRVTSISSRSSAISGSCRLAERVSYSDDKSRARTQKATAMFIGDGGSDDGDNGDGDDGASQQGLGDSTRRSKAVAQKKKKKRKTKKGLSHQAMAVGAHETGRCTFGNIAAAITRLRIPGSAKGVSRHTLHGAFPHVTHARVNAVLKMAVAARKIIQIKDSFKVRKEQRSTVQVSNTATLSLSQTHFYLPEKALGDQLTNYSGSCKVE